MTTALSYLDPFSYKIPFVPPEEGTGHEITYGEMLPGTERVFDSVVGMTGNVVGFIGGQIWNDPFLQGHNDGGVSFY